MFEKNLDAISNLPLKRRLSKKELLTTTAGITYCITPTNDYVLIKDDFPCDDLQNPREAVKKMLKENIKNEMGKNDIIINFGLGLGYLLDETYNNYPSRILIYEPDLDFLHFVLNNVDLSEILSSGRVYITNDLDELIEKLGSIYLTNDKVEIVYINNYALKRNKDLLNLTQRVLDTCKSKIVDVNTILKFSKEWLFNAIKNIATINSSLNVHKLSDLENRFEGQTALIAGAGPSLNDNLENIKNNREKLVIFAVNKVAAFLFENNITPDFIVFIDAKNGEKTLGNISNRLKDTNCIIDASSDYAVLKQPFKKIFINFSENDGVFSTLKKYNGIKFNDTGGSASILSLISAARMGFSKIILAGVDLAFKDNVIYAYGENMNRVSPDDILVDSVKKHLVHVKSVTGGIVTSREDYEAFINHFNYIIKELGIQNIYNISSFGAYIEGVVNTSFENIELNSTVNMNPIRDVEHLRINYEEFIKEEFVKINSIITQISKGIFSPALVSNIVHSTLLYQYMQSDVIKVLQQNFDQSLAPEFIENTKNAIKFVVNALQDEHLI